MISLTFRTYEQGKQLCNRYAVILLALFTVSTVFGNTVPASLALFVSTAVWGFAALWVSTAVWGMRAESDAGTPFALHG